VEPLLLSENVAIATAAHGGAKATQFCLESIFYSASGDFELILIDDCSPDNGQTRSLFLDAQRRHANTRVFSSAQNLEYTGSVNAILSHARADWIFFISNDIFITPLYLRLLLEAARADPRLGILRGSSNFVDNEGLLPHNVKAIRPATSLSDVFEIGEELASSLGPGAQNDPFLVGDAFLVTRAVICRIGGFDPWFYGYFADPDYGLRAQLAGFEIAVVPGAFAFHFQHANAADLSEEQRRAKNDRRAVRVYENWARFKLKWGLPVEMPYTGIGKLPWPRLRSLPFDGERHFSAPVDYSRHLI
jgi:GT2 family glycosyltransferase